MLPQRPGIPPAALTSLAHRGADRCRQKQALQDHIAARDSYLPGYEARLSHMPEDASLQHQSDAGNYLPHMHEAPLIAVFANPKLMTITDSELDRPSVVGGGSVYPAVQNFCPSQRGIGPRAYHPAEAQETPKNC